MFNVTKDLIKTSYLQCVQIFESFFLFRVVNKLPLLKLSSGPCLHGFEKNLTDTKHLHGSVFRKEEEDMSSKWFALLFLSAIFAMVAFVAAVPGDAAIAKDVDITDVNVLSPKTFLVLTRQSSLAMVTVKLLRTTSRIAK
ncbi:hypothetical protein EDC96DRAFT_549865 [Choanephora cucurbitarum]|nr:hypothetical protein EDC96DRAFT_549865 [Choanephora cucurbitarum]